MRLLLALALLALPAPAAGQGREMVEIEAGDPVSIRADRAYILFRTIRPEGVPSIEPVFLRVPTDADMARYRAAKREAYARAEPALIRRHQEQLRRAREAAAEGRRPSRPVDPPPSLETFAFAGAGPANLQNIEDGRALVRGRPESVFLVEVVPGDYVLYGATFGSGALTDALHACMCLGTVGFSAPAGVVTDLGHFLGDMVHRVSPIPELRAESGFGPSSNAYIAPIGATVRPAGPGTGVPDLLRGATVRAADYRAVGKFFDPRAMTVNRLVPVPGILAYEGGRVIDVRSGREAEGGHH
jgi:hypothetical protein